MLKIPENCSQITANPSFPVYKNNVKIYRISLYNIVSQLYAVFHVRLVCLSA